MVTGGNSCEYLLLCYIILEKLLQNMLPSKSPASTRYKAEDCLNLHTPLTKKLCHGTYIHGITIQPTSQTNERKGGMSVSKDTLFNTFRLLFKLLQKGVKFSRNVQTPLPSCPITIWYFKIHRLWPISNNYNIMGILSTE